MKYIILILISSLIGCTHYRHHENVEVEYGQVSLKTIEGEYINEGKYPDGELGYRLSEFVLPEFKDHIDTDILSVKVKNNEVICRALQGEKVLFEKTYFVGKDFEINRNKINLSSWVSCLGCNEVGALHLGAGMEGYTLFITKSGDAILRKSSTGVMLFYFFPALPVAFIDEKDILYKRKKL